MRDHIVAAAFAACPVLAFGQVSLESDFDHGSLQSWSVAGASSAPTVNLVGRDNFYGGGEWRWLNFVANGVAGTIPSFRISDDFAGGSSRLNSHPMVFSEDGGQSWDFFDNNARSGGLFRFSHSRAFSTNNVQVAYALPYSYGMSVDHTQSVLATSWARPTLSGDTNGVIGMSPGGVDDLGRTIAPRAIFAYQITNPLSTTPKSKVIIATGQHAGETIGTHTFQGLVDFLVSDDPRAAAVRDAVEVLAYPTLNPDGRFAGHSRSTVENPNVDSNGLWHPSRWAGHEDIQANGEAMQADILETAADVDVFIDFHSTIPANPGDDFGFLEYEQGDAQDPFWLALRERQPNVLDLDSTGTSWTSANFAEVFLGAKLDITFETQFGFERNVDYHHQLGENFGLALYDAYATPVPEPVTMLTFAPLSTLLLGRRR